MFPMKIGIKYKENEIKLLNTIYDLTKKVGFIWYFKGICFICDRSLFINKKGVQLHHDSEPAISYSDGYSVWCLNGVNVPRYLVETPKEKLDIDFFKTEKNADVRAEFIRKYGIERMVGLGKVIETVENHENDWFNKSEYQLIDMGSIYGRKYAPHLKMKNLTTGIYHLEGVDPSCRTVEQALKWRAKGKEINIKSIK